MVTGMVALLCPAGTVTLAGTTAPVRGFELERFTCRSAAGAGVTLSVAVVLPADSSTDAGEVLNANDPAAGTVKVLDMPVAAPSALTATNLV